VRNLNIMASSPMFACMFDALSILRTPLSMSSVWRESNCPSTSTSLSAFSLGLSGTLSRAGAPNPLCSPWAPQREAASPAERAFAGEAPNAPSGNAASGMIPVFGSGSRAPASGGVQTSAMVGRTVGWDGWLDEDGSDEAAENGAGDCGWRGPDCCADG